MRSRSAAARFVARLRRPARPARHAARLTPAPNVRHRAGARATADGACSPGQRYEVAAEAKSPRSRRWLRAHAGLSAAEALRQCVYGNAVRAPGGGCTCRSTAPGSRCSAACSAERPGFTGPLRLHLGRGLRLGAGRARGRRIWRSPTFACSASSSTTTAGGASSGSASAPTTSRGLPVVSLRRAGAPRAHPRRRDRPRVLRPAAARQPWLRRHRDRNGDGLLEWGYEPDGDTASRSRALGAGLRERPRRQPHVGGRAGRRDAALLRRVGGGPERGARLRLPAPGRAWRGSSGAPMTRCSCEPTTRRRAARSTRPSGTRRAASTRTGAGRAPSPRRCHRPAASSRSSRGSGTRARGARVPPPRRRTTFGGEWRLP